jgi:hypothetical protein
VVLEAVIDLISGEMTIPVIGRLVKLIFGTELTFLDLIAFVIALPASTIIKIGGFSSSPGLVGAENAWDPNPDDLAAAKQYANNCYAFQGFYGMSGMTYAIFGSVDDPSAFKGKGSATLVGNIFSNSGLITKMFYPNVPKLTIATDVIRPFAAAFAHYRC